MIDYKKDVLPYIDELAELVNSLNKIGYKDITNLLQPIINKPYLYYFKLIVTLHNNKPGVCCYTDWQLQKCNHLYILPPNSDFNTTLKEVGTNLGDSRKALLTNYLLNKYAKLTAQPRTTKNTIEVKQLKPDEFNFKMIEAYFKSRPKGLRSSKAIEYLKT